MKKIFSIVIIFGVLILISNSVFAAYYAEEEYKKRVNAFKTALDSYMQTFMTEETPEEDRIKEYIYTGFSVDDSEDKLKATISFHVTPVNENNTTWGKKGDMCFTVFSKMDNEYVLEKISRYPDNYDKFLERFEEYKKSKSETTESTQIQGKEITNSLANQEIEKMSNIIFISCLIILLVVLIPLIRKIITSISTIL